uniref:G patch domain-containing protein 2-like isoform X2 n=1 Tax=Myxine glutinosa TaxID=7769 RepID=UPI00358F6A32
MDELVHDLVSALEETSEQNKAEEGEDCDATPGSPRFNWRHGRKRRGRKRRSETVHGLMVVGTGRTGGLSEGSESSLEEATCHGVLGRVAAGGCTGPIAALVAGVEATSVTPSAQVCGLSDSDEALSMRRHRAIPISPSSPLAACPTRISLPARHSWHESDSFPESACGRPARRRRKVKRMAVDPPLEGSSEHGLFVEMPSAVGGNHTDTVLGSAPSLEKRRQIKSRGCAEMVEVQGQVESTGSKKTNKVKREQMDCEDEEEGQRQTDEHMIDSDSSSLGSSDGGLFTNDEGRQADDEQSDWFGDTELESTCGLPGVGRWWEREQAEEKDPVFESILAGSFPLMSRSSQRGFQARLARWQTTGPRGVRKARRRPPGKVTLGMGFSERLSPHYPDLHSREFWPYPLVRKERTQLRTMGSLYTMDKHADPCRSNTLLSRSRQLALGSTCADDVKRRRKTAPTGIVGETARPIPESNVGSRLLQNLGWIPGTGLGPQGRGITEPIGAVSRPKGTGLGYNFS